MSTELTAEALLPILYDQLHDIAARVRGRQASLSVSPNTLVHEAWLRISRDRERTYDRVHFCALAARSMRHVLVDLARRRGAVKRGGDLQPITLVDLGEGEEPVDLLALDAALEELAKEDPRAAEIVQLRFLGGLSVEEVAGVLGVSDRTVKSDWRAARAWLQARLRRD